MKIVSLYKQVERQVVFAITEDVCRVTARHAEPGMGI